MKSVLGMFVVLLSTGVFAQTAPTDQNSSTVNSKDVTPSQVSGKADIDDEITNARLRAVSGAKSNFSFSSNFNYAGSSILTPLSTTRVQLNSQNNSDPTNINGQMAVKYRLTEHDSLLAGFGVQYTPSQTTASGSSIAQQTSASSPYIDYNRAFRAGSAQHVIDISLSKYTLGTDTSSDLNWNLSLQDQVMFNVAKSKLELGAAVGYSQDIYNGSPLAPASKTDPTLVPTSSYYYSQFFLEPVAEYALSDKTSLRTVYRMLILNQDPNNRTNWSTPSFQTESFGVGYAVTRDIYLYPNVQWSWSQIALDSTTIGFTANINL